MPPHFLARGPVSSLLPTPQRRELFAGASLPVLQREYKSVAEAVQATSEVTESLQRARALLTQQIDQTGATMAVLGEGGGSRGAGGKAGRAFRRGGSGDGGGIWRKGWGHWGMGSGWVAGIGKQAGRCLELEGFGREHGAGRVTCPKRSIQVRTAPCDPSHNSQCTVASARRGNVSACVTSGLVLPALVWSRRRLQQQHAGPGQGRVRGAEAAQQKGRQAARNHPEAGEARQVRRERVSGGLWRSAF